MSNFEPNYSGPVSASEGYAETSNGAEPQYVSTKTSVWWDIENCQVGRGVDAHSIARNISSALVRMNYSGPVSISAYGDTNLIPAVIQRALSNTGISLNHVPTGVKNASDLKILVDMLFWAVDNPAPANFLLISGDGDFANALHQLRMRRYNILIAQPQKASPPLLAAAKSVWLWTTLMAGGMPLSKSESLQLVSNSNLLVSNGLPTPNADLGPPKFPAHSLPDNSVQGNPRIPPDMVRGIDGIGNQTQVWLNHSNMPHSVSMPVDNQGNMNNLYPQNLGFRHAPPNQFPQLYVPKNADSFASRPAPNYISNSFDYFQNSGSNFRGQNGFRQPHLQPFRPMPNNLSMRPTSAPGAPFGPHPPRYVPHHAPSRPSAHNFASSPITNVPDMGKSDSSKGSSGNLGLQPRMNNTKGSSLEYSIVRKASTSSVVDLAKANTEVTPDGSSCNGDHSDMTQSASSSRLIVCEVVKNGTVDKIQATENGLGTNTECQKIPDDIHDSMKNILSALETLKKEKIMPTEDNIHNCILYGNFEAPRMDVKKAIHSALEHQLIERQILGPMPLYVGRNQRLWKCTNLKCGHVKMYPTETWDKIEKFLADPVGRVAMIESKCRYEAGVILRSSCLKELLLGNVLQILETIITFKKWISPNHSGWQPVTINLPKAESDSEDKFPAA